MKLAAITVAATIAATASSAAELGVSGLSLGGEIVAERNVTSGTNSIVLTPEASYEVSGFVATVSTDIDIYSTPNGFYILDREFKTIRDDFTLDFSVEKELMTNTVAYVESSYNVDAQDMGDVVVGISFSF